VTGGDGGGLVPVCTYCILPLCSVPINCWIIVASILSYTYTLLGLDCEDVHLGTFKLNEQQRALCVFLRGRERDGCFILYWEGRVDDLEQSFIPLFLLEFMW